MSTKWNKTVAYILRVNFSIRPVTDIQQPSLASLQPSLGVGRFADKAAVIFDTQDNAVWLIGLNSHNRIGYSLISGDKNVLGKTTPGMYCLPQCPMAFNIGPRSAPLRVRKYSARGGLSW